MRGVDYAPDSVDGEEHGTEDGKYDDSAHSLEGNAIILRGDVGEDHDVVETLGYLDSLPEWVFSSDRAAAELVQSWLPIMVLHAKGILMYN